jgi:hypothetical protein
MFDPSSSARAAVAQALDDVGLAPDGDEDIASDFLVALKEYGFVIVREDTLGPKGGDDDAIGSSPCT